MVPTMTDRPRSPQTIKLTATKARDIRERFAAGESIEELTCRFEVSDQAIKDVLNYETWAAAGGPRVSKR
jgi:hypothetical protein